MKNNADLCFDPFSGVNAFSTMFGHRVHYQKHLLWKDYNPYDAHGRLKNPFPVPRTQEERGFMREQWFTSYKPQLHGIGCFAHDKILVSRRFMQEFFL